MDDHGNDAMRQGAAATAKAPPGTPPDVRGIPEAPVPVPLAEPGESDADLAARYGTNAHRVHARSRRWDEVEAELGAHWAQRPHAPDGLGWPAAAAIARKAWEQAGSSAPGPRAQDAAPGRGSPAASGGSA